MEPPQEELTRRLEESLRRTNSELDKHTRSILMAREISLPQFNALLSILEFGPLTMGELGRQLNVACSTATDLVARLEKTGLAERFRDENDRRMNRVRLLDKGEQAVAAVISERRRFIGDVLGDYSEEELRQLIESLELLEQRMSLK